MSKLSVFGQLSCRRDISRRRPFGTGALLAVETQDLKMGPAGGGIVLCRIRYICVCLASIDNTLTSFRVGCHVIALFIVCHVTLFLD